MSWMLSIWVAAALLALCKGQNTVHEGNSLSASGYHLCINNETRNVSFLVVHTVSDTVTKKCGDWLLWRTCTVTVYKMTYKTEYKTVTEQVTRCCNSYEQVGRYCALPVNRSVEFTAKPGSCPTVDGLHPRYEDCEWDMDCPGWLKCCQSLRGFLCTDPASSANYSENGGCRFNATVTVKTDYQQLMSNERGHLNHIRLLQAMVTGALQSDVSVYYLSSQPVHPYRSATSLLIESNCTLSLYNVTSKLHLLLKHIQEVSSVTVEDVDECAEPALRQCSPHADCNNTVGSYHCACRQGYIDVDPNNPGAHCTADVMVATTTEPPFTYLPPMTTTCPPAFTTETSMTTALSNTSPVPYNNSSHAPQWTTSAPYSSMSSTVESPLPTTTCSPPSITSVWAANVTGTSFCVYWSSHFQTNQTYQVVLSKGSEVIQSGGTSQTMLEVRDLQPGVLYNVTVTPRSCGGQGVALQISVKTDAQTLDVTVRLTNIEFTADLQNTSSQAYENLTESIGAEIYQSLSPEIKALVDSGQVRIEIRGFSPGSVVVIFSIISTPSQSQDISNVSTAVLNSLINITKYTVDRNSTSTTDFNECASGENDCSQSATCTNTWASYTCVCLDGFIDNNPERPGRACQAIATTTTAPTTTMTAPTTTTTALITTATAPTTIMTAPTTTAAPTTMAAPTSTMTATATTISAPTTIAASAVTTTAPTTTITVTTTTATAPTTTTAATITAAPAITTTASPTATSALTTTTAAPTTTTTVSTITAAPATITTASTTITAAPTTTTSPTTTTAAPTTTTSPTTTTAAPTTTTSPTTTTAAPTTTTTASTITAAPAIITTASTTTTAAPTTTTTASTITAAPAIITTASTTITTSPTTTTAAPTTATAATTSAPITTVTAPTTTTTVPTTTTTSTITTIPTTTTTTSTTTTSTAMIPMTSTPTTTLTIPTTSITSPTTSGGAVRTATTAISVQCRLAAITVTIDRDFLQNNNIRESTLYLGLPECGVNGGNATHAQLTVAWNECGTSLVHNDTYYTTSVTLFNSMDMYTSSSGAVEVPRKRLEVPIMCTYMKSMLISADFGSMGYDMIQDLIMGYGSFQVTVQLMNGTMPLPHNYSLSSEETVVVEVSVNTSSDQIKVVINKCWATPTQNPADTPSETFLENSCSLNQYTTVLMNGNSSTSRVSVQIFSVVDMDVIYLHCQVQICVEIGLDTCVPDCLQRTSRSSHTIGSTLRTYGPVWRSGEDSLEEGYTTLHIVGLSCLGIGLSLLFIIGFLCLFYYQRNRIGNYNFNAKPKQENFTYLVFNT